LCSDHDDNIITLSVIIANFSDGGRSLVVQWHRIDRTETDCFALLSILPEHMFFMEGNMRTTVLLLAISALMIFGSAQVFAQNDCHTAIRNRVIQNNPRVEKVLFDQDSETRLAASSPVSTDTIKGNGRFLRHTGKWEDISWTCNFDTRNNRVVTAEYSVAQGGPAMYDADTSKGWPKDCQEAVRNQVSGEHQNAEKVGFKSALQSDFFKTDKLLQGDGFWERKDGVKKEFSYWCVYNTKSQQIVDKNYLAGE
jgi:hypothetical protein